jgi:putative transposase
MERCPHQPKHSIRSVGDTSLLNNYFEMNTEKFRNKYRVPSARAAWWDYGWNGAYFITICTKNRLHYFGTIENRKMTLANCGVLADVFWHEIPNHSNYVELGAFVVMPNHIHGILILDVQTWPVQTLL